MKLLIISNMSHYVLDDRIVGWGPTVQEIDHLATLFDEVQHVGCLHPGTAPVSSLPYSTDNVHFVPLPPAGGDQLKDKFQITKLIPQYLSTITRELNSCDVVHLRCPANIPLLALFVLIFKKRPIKRWAKYAGNWGAGQKYPFFYRLQRWILDKDITKSVVTVNGVWPNQKPFVHSFHNPCLTEVERKNASLVALNKKISAPIRMIFVGALNERKGIDRLLEIALQLIQDKIPFILDILGDGPARNRYEAWSEEHSLADQVFFHGWVPKTGLFEYYQKAHVNILPSESEGWPKVLSEGMAFGVVPVASSVASIPQVLENTQAGIAISPYDNIRAYAETINRLVNSPDIWQEYSTNAVRAAAHFTYDTYLENVKKLFMHQWGISL